MKYYKIIKDNNFIGVVNSLNFICYHVYDEIFMRADEIFGQFIEYQGKLYRDTWMVPTPNNINIEFEQAFVVEIDEATYLEFYQAIENNETIQIDDEPVIINIPDPVEEVSIEFMRDSKIKEMSYACHTTIENGFDLMLHDTIHHFSLTTQDQLNLMSLNTIAQTESIIPYHADGEEVIFYTAEEINQIIEAATKLKIYQTTYFNSLKAYINALETIEDIAAIEYGVEIPDQYKSEALKILE